MNLEGLFCISDEFQRMMRLMCVKQVLFDQPHQCERDALYLFSCHVQGGRLSPRPHFPYPLPCLASSHSVSMPRISTLASASRGEVSQDIGKRPRYQARDTAAKK